MPHRRLAPRLLASLLLPLALAVPGTASAIGPPVPGAVSASTLKLPSGPGSVRGLAEDASVQLFSGAVDQHVPFVLPEAVSGFSPRLELTYSGDLGQGPVGVGWALTSASIRRSLRDGVPAYADGDALEMVGIVDGDLVPVAGGEYRILGDPMAARVRRIGLGFEVVDGKGTRYKLGQNPAARLEGEGKTAEWFVEEITDLAGQTVRFGYRRDGGRLYLSDLTWGPGGAFVTTLEYGARPDAVISYRTGFRVATTQRLSKVHVKAFGAEARTYELGYDDSRPLSRLASVRLVGANGVDALPTTRFTYASTETPRQAAVPGVSGWVLNQRGTTLLDIDNDALPDLVRLEAGNYQARRNLGGSFDSARTLSGFSQSDLSTIRLVDVDGDSQADLVRYVDDSWRLYRLAGDTWQLAGAIAGSTGLSLNGTRTSYLDVNGDQRVDVLTVSGSATKLHVGTATGFAAPRPGPAISAGNPAIVPGATGLRWNDVNGDGLDDAIWVTETWLQVYLGKGDGSFVEQPRRTFPWDASTRLSDVDLADLDRDGLVDLVRYSSGKVSAYRGQADGTFARLPLEIGRPEGADLDVVVTIADVNGNGSQDVVWSSPRGLWILDLAGTTTAGMLVAIDNGLGKVQKLSYTASTRLSAEDRAAGNAWTLPMPVSIPVPTRVELDFGGVTPSRIVEHRVRDGFWVAPEHRFGGFLQSTTTTDAGTPGERVEVIRYHQGLADERVLRGRPLSTRTEAAGRLVQLEDSRWTAVVVDGMPAGEPRLRRAVLAQRHASFHEAVATPIETLTTYGYDGLGRQIEAHDSGRLDLLGDERWIRHRYASDETTGVRDRIIEETHLAGDGTTVLSQRRQYYGDAQALLPWGQIGKGWLRQVDALLIYGSENRWVTVQQNQYDALGQPTVETVNGVTRRMAYDAHGLHPVRETVDVGGGATLAWSAIWDDTLGVPTDVTDASGITTHASYDSLGRVKALGLAGRPAHTIYSYDASAPLPSTTTYQFDGRLEVLAPFTEWRAGSGWRQSTSVTNGAGEAVFEATRVAAARWSVSGLRTRDARGRVIAIAEPFYADTITGLTSAPATVPRERLSYDALGRPAVQTLPTGGVRSLAYTAFAQTASETDLAPVVQRFDGLGRIVHSERRVNGVLEQVDASYDGASRVLALSLQNGGVVHRFQHDTLGRLRRGEDPDTGVRTYTYDDNGLLLTQTDGAGGTVTRTYDGAGRPLTAVDAGGKRYAYHYDQARLPAARNTRSRLAWVEEPSGTVDFSYDELGRQSWMRRVVDGRAGEKSVRYSPSGLVLSVTNDDGFVADTRYDDAGRAIGVGDYWTALELDAAGRVREQRFGNGVREKIDRDDRGLSKAIQVLDGAGHALYDVELVRNTMGRIGSVRDRDGVGLDHSASYTFDPAARLVRAEQGPAARPFVFTYGYDDLQNMVSRTASGPLPVDVLTGVYRYGQGQGLVPRQLASVTAANGQVTSFAYDRAGRQIVDGERRFVYDGFDQLQRVERAGATLVENAYGYDGMRVASRTPRGDTQRWFTEDLVERAGTRQHYLRIGGRTLARVDSARPAAAATIAAVPGWLTQELAGAVGLTLLLGGLALAASRRAGRTRFTRATAALVLASFAGACVGEGAPAFEATGSALTVSNVLYFHEGAAAGPVLITRGSGQVADERRFEPFGAPIEAVRPGVTAGAVDFALDPTNALNKETDVESGLSYHGARWLNPRTARWTLADPPTRAPDPGFMNKPWALHPYQYVDQNPVEFWDPDGREKLQSDGWGMTSSVPPGTSASTSSVAYTPQASTVSHATSARPVRSVERDHSSIAQDTTTPSAPVDATPAPAPVAQPRNSMDPPEYTNAVTPTMAAASAVFWDAVGLTKVGGAVNLVVDVAITGIAYHEGATEEVKQGGVNIGLDVAGFFSPHLGVVQLVWDVGATGMRAYGYSAEQAPTFGEYTLDVIKSEWNKTEQERWDDAAKHMEEALPGSGFNGG